MSKKKMNANDKLKEAASIMEERGKTYDSPQGERSMGKAINAFNIISGHSLSESEGWLLMQILKDVRQWSRTEYHKDSADDCIAYSALKAEALEAEHKNSCTEPVSDGDGWIEWNGGECPFKSPVYLNVRTRNREILHDSSVLFRWHHANNINGMYSSHSGIDDPLYDIIAYQIIKP